MYPLWRPVGPYKRYKKTCEKCQNNCETDTFPVTVIGKTFKINLGNNQILVTIKHPKKVLCCIELFILNLKNLKVHQCRFENLPTSSSSYENDMLRISH